MTWREAVPYLYRNLVGMIRFPVIDDKVAVYEQAPTDVFFIPDNSQNVAGAKQLLRFLARPEVQAELNSAIGMLAPNPEQVETDDHLLNASYRFLRDSAGLGQFYDRDNREPISS